MTRDATLGPMIDQLRELGVRPGDILLVHSSYKSLGNKDLSPDEIIDALLQAVGEDGTLLMPALSYNQQPVDVHSTLDTPSQVGVIPESFRKRRGVIRSVHPTHSACGTGPAVAHLLGDHRLDRTPCGPHSPFRKILNSPAKILMLGCGLRPNTTMHAIEELVGTDYLFGEDREYQITDAEGRRHRQIYRTHGFRGWSQRYDRVALLDHPGLLRAAIILGAESQLIAASDLLTAATKALQGDQFFFVERRPVSG